MKSIELKDITKSFGSLEALKQVSLSVAEGEFYGFLGPNGAGKSTLLRILSGFLDADGGEILIQGNRVEGYVPKLRRSIGLVPQEIALYTRLNAIENCIVFGELVGLSASEIKTSSQELLEAVGLWDRRKEPVSNFSGGMKRRLNIIVALLHRPKILLCDEPTVGVDPQSRNAIFDFLQSQREAGLTVLYTTHYMEEAERLCDRIAIIDHGKIIEEGTKEELLSKLSSSVVLKVQRSEHSKELGEVISAYSEHWEVGTEDYFRLKPEIRLSDVYREVEARGLPDNIIQVKQTGLEELFLELTGRTLRDD